MHFKHFFYNKKKDMLLVLNLKMIEGGKFHSESGRESNVQ